MCAVRVGTSVDFWACEFAAGEGLAWGGDSKPSDVRVRGVGITWKECGSRETGMDTGPWGVQEV